MVRKLLATLLGVAAVANPAIAGDAGPEASSAPASATGPALELPRLLGFENGKLVRIDPQSLLPRPGKRISVGSGGCAPRNGGTACWRIPPWTVSPSGQRLAIARNNVSSVQLVDVRRLRVTANVRVEGGAIGALAWLTPGRVVALQEVAGERQLLLALDLANGRVAARHALGGSVNRLARTPRELVILLAPARAIGPARIAVVDGKGAVRLVRLKRILAGSKVLETGSDHRVETRLPGLAVDAERRRAFVVDKSVAAEIDLRSLAVSYRALERQASSLARAWTQLRPAAETKQTSGHVRETRWLGGNLIAVSGTDSEEGRTHPAGLLVVDTRGWRVRMIDRNATSFGVAGDLLLATGASWDAATGPTSGIGLVAYGLDGGKRFHLFDNHQAWLAQVYGGRAYVAISGDEALRIVDLASGRVIATRQQPLPWLLLGSGTGWW